MPQSFDACFVGAVLCSVGWILMLVDVALVAVGSGYVEAKVCGVGWILISAYVAPTVGIWLS